VLGDATGWVAASKSPTGTVYYASSVNSTPTTTKPTKVGDLVDTGAATPINLPTTAPWQ
jgi:hypothetical protein